MNLHKPKILNNVMHDTNTLLTVKQTCIVQKLITFNIWNLCFLPDCYVIEKCHAWITMTSKFNIAIFCRHLHFI